MNLPIPRKIAPFDLKNCQEKSEKTTLTLWVDEALKEDYDEIQKLSGKKFSKHLVDIVTAEIENVKNQAG